MNMATVEAELLKTTDDHLTSYDVIDYPFKEELFDDPDFGTSDEESLPYADDRIYMLGEMKVGFQTAGPPHNYDVLSRRCLKDGKLFVDENFEPGTGILPDSFKDATSVEWKRPKEISKNAKFTLSGPRREDVCQGSLGDCWFLAALANLTCNMVLFDRIVPPGQSFDEDYCGIFRFRFWQFGKWVEVVIDDLLPTQYGQLIFTKSASENQLFWSALLEKAYAKLYGSYKKIEGGSITEALEDMCGGLSEMFEASNQFIWDILSKSFQHSSLVGCSIRSSEAEDEEIQSMGLIAKHAYSIIGLESFVWNGKTVDLLRIRNPWGDETKWKGDWSDSSEKWDHVPIEVKNRLYNNKDDGEFWMERNDFQKHFSMVNICHLNPDPVNVSDKKKWYTNTFEGIWVKNLTAGGNSNNRETFPNNPQYFFVVHGSPFKKYSVMLSLMQKNKRSTLGDEQNICTGLYVYAVDKRGTFCLNKSFFRFEVPLKRSFSYGRQLTMQLNLPSGKYCVIPCTYEPNVFGRYFLRVFSEVNIRMQETDEIGYPETPSNNFMFREEALKVVDNTFPSIFKEIAGDTTEVGRKEVQKILLRMYPKSGSGTDSFPEVFSEEVCRSIISLWDGDCSGKLNFNEFKALLTDIATLELTFNKFISDKSGTLNGSDLKSMLIECGYKVDKKLLNAVMLRYEVDGSIPFDHFVVCAFKLKILFEEYNARKTEENDTVKLSRDDFMRISLLT